MSVLKPRRLGEMSASDCGAKAIHNSAGRLAFVDPVRGFAVLAVFLYHALSADEKLLFSTATRTRDLSDLYRLCFLPFNFGYLGVAVFFVVSGFCIHLSFVQQGSNWKKFFARRFFRLYPAYLLWLLFFAFVLPFSRLRWGMGELASLNLLDHALLIHNLHPLTFWGINGSFWSIGVEVQLYLLYPVLIWLAARCGWGRAMLLTGVCELSIVCARVMLPSIRAAPDGSWASGVGPAVQFLSQLSATPLAYWLSWSLGAWLANRHLNAQHLFLSKVPIWIGLVLVVVCYMFSDLHLLTFVAAAAATSVIMAHLLEKEQAQSLIIPRWLQAVGRVGLYSYSIYLLHQPLMYAITTNLLQNRDCPPFIHYFVSVSTVIFVIPLAYLCYHFVEVPGIALGRRLLKRRQGHVPAMSSARSTS